jgi:hypothetical protein
MMPTRVWIWTVAAVGGLIVFEGGAMLLEHAVDDARLASGVSAGLGAAAAALIAKAISRRVALRRHMQDR